MTTNRLAKSETGQHFRSGIRALEWAAMARDKHLPKHVEAWEKAHDDGWDTLHYDPSYTEELRERIAAQSRR